MKARLFLLYSILALPLALPASWYSDCKLCEKHLGGDSKIGPFATKPECDKYVKLNRDNYYNYRDCYGDDEAGASSSSSNAGLEKSTSDALAHGLAYGDSQTFGVGLIGLGALAVMNSGPSSDDAARQRAQQLQWEQEERERVERQERDFERLKEETESELMTGEAGPEEKAAFGIVAKDPDALKDAPLSKKKKKFKPPRLRPVANPIYKLPRGGDRKNGMLFDDEAAAAVGCDGLQARHFSGKIACCPEGFAYFCNGFCYSEAALNDFRIPCNSKLKTLKN